VPSILNKFPTVTPAKHPYTITPPPYFTVGKIHVEAINNTTDGPNPIKKARSSTNEP